MAYRIAAIPMTLSDLQGHSPTAILFKCDFCMAVQQFTRSRLTECVTRFLCDSWASRSCCTCIWCPRSMWRHWNFTKIFDWCVQTI